MTPIPAVIDTPVIDTSVTVAVEAPARPKRTRKAKVIDTPMAVVVADISKLTHPELTKTFNALVPVANGLGITWARVHTSAFETKAGGVKQVERLQAAIAEASAQAAR